MLVARDMVMRTSQSMKLEQQENSDERLAQAIRERAEKLQNEMPRFFMGLDLEFNEVQTPIDEDEREGLLIHTITNRRELDEFEQLNIEEAVEWTIRKKISIENILTEHYVRELHRKMFGRNMGLGGRSSENQTRILVLTS